MPLSEFVGTFSDPSFAAIEQIVQGNTVNIFCVFFVLREIYALNLRYIQYGDLLVTCGGEFGLLNSLLLYSHGRGTPCPYYEKRKV